MAAFFLLHKMEESKPLLLLHSSTDRDGGLDQVAAEVES